MKPFNDEIAWNEIIFEGIRLLVAAAFVENNSEHEDFFERDGILWYLLCVERMKNFAVRLGLV